MNCNRAQDRLSQYVDGELSASERLQVESHLETCARCRAEERAIRRTALMVRSWGMVNPPPELQRRLDPALFRMPSRNAPRYAPLLRLQAMMHPASGLVAASLLVVTLLAGGNMPVPDAGQPATPSRRATAPVEPAAPAPVVAPPARPAPPASLPAPRTQVPPAAAEANTSLARPAAKRRVARRAKARLTARGRSGRRGSAARMARRQAPVARPSEPLREAESLYARGRVQEAVGVLNAEFERSAQRCPQEMRAVYSERNALADSTISECTYALRRDPGNPNARKVLNEAYSIKVSLVRSLAG